MIGLLFILLLSAMTTQLEVRVNYNKDPYQAIREVFGSNGVQNSDNCDDKLKHLTSDVDSILKRNVFRYHLHINKKYTDGDRCNGDYSRQRMETSVSYSSPQWMKGHKGKTFTFAWKLFLDSQFKAAPTFCHLHQIKYDGIGGTPNLTLTARTSEIQLQNQQKILAKASLNSFKGSWIQIREKITYNVKGCVDFKAYRIKDGAQLMSYNACDVNLDPGNNMIRPKFGFYRSLQDGKLLKDESVGIVDICVGQNDSCHYDKYGNRYSPNQSSLRYQ